MTFAALADPARRAVLERLSRGEASITHLADRCAMTLTGMKKHVGVLERAGLVATRKAGRVRLCRLGPRRLEAEAQWIAGMRAVWTARFDALDRVVADIRIEERENGDDQGSDHG